MNQTKSKTREGQSTTWSSVSSHKLKQKKEQPQSFCRAFAELLQMQAGWDKYVQTKDQ